MKDVEFEEKEDLGIPVRHKDPPPDSLLARKLMENKIVPSGRHANILLIVISIIIFLMAVVFFALSLRS